MIRVAASFGADLERHVYWSGHSNGCAMAQRMAAQAPNIVAAVGCHSLYLLIDESDFPTAAYAPKRVPIIEVHGTADSVVSYHGFMGSSARQNLQRWASHNGCPNVTAPHECVLAAAKRRGKDRVEFSRHTGCEGGADVALLSLPGVGHTPHQGKDTDVDTTQVARSPEAAVRQQLPNCVSQRQRSGCAVHALGPARTDHLQASFLV